MKGYFFIAFGGHLVRIPVLSSANDMQKSLEFLPTIGTVQVSHEEIKNGFLWIITFLTNDGDALRYGDITNLLVSIDPIHSLSSFVSDTTGYNGTIIGEQARVKTKQLIKAYTGYEQ